MSQSMSSVSSRHSDKIAIREWVMWHTHTNTHGFNFCPLFFFFSSQNICSKLLDIIATVITLNVFFLAGWWHPWDLFAFILCVSVCARFSFQVGDLVLIILDERHDNYVLFTVGPTLYFLHSESLAALDLKPGQRHFNDEKLKWIKYKCVEAQMWLSVVSP